MAPRANGTESTDAAAVGTAAYRVLDAIFPAQRERRRARYDEWLAGIPDGRAKKDGIRVGAQARTAADPNWTPLVETPPNPDYPSGHTCRTAAQMTAYAYFFGRDDVSFSAFSGG